MTAEGSVPRGWMRRRIDEDGWRAVRRAIGDERWQRVHQSVRTGQAIEDDGLLAALAADQVRGEASLARRSAIITLFPVLLGMLQLLLVRYAAGWWLVLHVAVVVLAVAALAWYAVLIRRARHRLARLQPHAIDDEALAEAVAGFRTRGPGGPQGFPRGSWWPPRTDRDPTEERT